MSFFGKRIPDTWQLGAKVEYFGPKALRHVRGFGQLAVVKDVIIKGKYDKYQEILIALLNDRGVECSELIVYDYQLICLDDYEEPKVVQNIFLIDNTWHVHQGSVSFDTPSEFKQPKAGDMVQFMAPSPYNFYKEDVPYVVLEVHPTSIVIDVPSIGEKVRIYYDYPVTEVTL